MYNKLILKAENSFSSTMLMICKGKIKESLNPMYVTEHPNTFVLIMK